jgi:hypothetical protein
MRLRPMDLLRTVSQTTMRTSDASAPPGANSGDGGTTSFVAPFLDKDTGSPEMCTAKSTAEGPADEVVPGRAPRHKSNRVIEIPVCKSPEKLWLSDVDYDRQRRAALVAKMSAAQPYDEADDVVVDEGGALLERCLAGDLTGAKQLAHAPTVDKAITLYDAATNHLVGAACASIAGATPEEIVAYLMDFNSRYFQSRRDPKFDVRCDVLETVSDHRTVIYNEFTTAPGFSNRAILNSMVWKKVRKEPPTFIWVAAPLDNHKLITRSDERHAVRAEVMRVCRLTLTSPSTNPHANDWGLEHTGGGTGGSKKTKTMKKTKSP